MGTLLSSTIRRRALFAALAVVGVVLVIISNPRNSDSRCVGGRVQIKTLSDSGDVSFHPVPATIPQLVSLPRPARVDQARRSRPVEARTYKIRARLVWMIKRSTDEIDVGVATPTGRVRTMLAGFEGSRICSHSAVVRGETPMKRARKQLFAACGKPGRVRVRLRGTAEITGVGYFGHKHGTGAARNGIELHPVVRFDSADCQRIRHSRRRISRT